MTESSIGTYRIDTNKLLQFAEFDFWMVRNDEKYAKRTKSAPNQWESCQILPKYLKHRATADQISLRVFRVRQKQNILEPSTRRDVFISAKIEGFPDGFKKVFRR